MPVSEDLKKMLDALTPEQKLEALSQKNKSSADVVKELLDALTPEQKLEALSQKDEQEPPRPPGPR